MCIRDRHCTGNERLFKVHLCKALDKWLLDADHVELWQSKKLTASYRRNITTQWVGDAAKLDVEMGVENRVLIEKSNLAIRADGSHGIVINVEGVEREFFMDADCTPETVKDILPASPAPADQEHPSGSGNEDDYSDEEGGETNSGANDELAILDIEDVSPKAWSSRPSKSPRGTSWRAQHLRHSQRKSSKGR